MLTVFLRCQCAPALLPGKTAVLSSEQDIGHRAETKVPKWTKWTISTHSGFWNRICDLRMCREGKCAQSPRKRLDKTVLLY